MMYEIGQNNLFFTDNMIVSRLLYVLYVLLYDGFDENIHNRFGSRLCGAGEGDCSRDSDCSGSLVINVSTPYVPEAHISSFHIDTRLLDVSMCSSNLKVCGNNNCLTEYSKSGGNWGPDDDCCTRFSDDMTFI